MNIIDRYKGSLLGLAVGEALGAPLMGKKPSSFKPMTNMAGGGVLDTQPGQWLDGLAMAMCVSGSLLKEGFSPQGQIERYFKLFKNGYVTDKNNGIWKDLPFDASTREAFHRFEMTGNQFCGMDTPETAVNVPLKRLAPLAMYFARTPLLAIAQSGESSKTTHAAQECVDACRYFAGLVVGALTGVDKNKLMSDFFEPQDGVWAGAPITSKIRETASGSFKLRRPPTIRGSTNVVLSLEAALWAFYHSESFEEGVLKSINLGEDSSGTGAILGQLAGAFYGINGIPKEWLWQIVKGEAIEEQAVCLYLKARSL